LSTGKRHSG